MVTADVRVGTIWKRTLDGKTKIAQVISASERSFMKYVSLKK